MRRGSMSVEITTNNKNGDINWLAGKSVPLPFKTPAGHEFVITGVKSAGVLWVINQGGSSSTDLLINVGSIIARTDYTIRLYWELVAT